MHIQADGQIWIAVLSLAGVTIVAVAIPPVSSPFAIVEANLPIGMMGWSWQSMGSMGRRDARLLGEKNRSISMKGSAWGVLRKASNIESFGADRTAAAQFLCDQRYLPAPNIPVSSVQTMWEIARSVYGLNMDIDMRGIGGPLP